MQHVAGRKPDPNPGPYRVTLGPAGATVICREHSVIEGIKGEEAQAIASSLNNEFQKRMGA